MSNKKEVFGRLRKGMLGLDEDMTVEAAKNVIKGKFSAVEAVSVLTDTIRIIGEKFGKHELYLPDLMIAADAMNKAINLLEPELKKEGADIPSKGTIIIGTVKGDIHDLGKTIVNTMLTAEGFTVIDVGKDVPNSAFLDAAEKYKPDIIGLSATMTTTMPMQKDVIEYFTALDVRDKYKIIVGGAALSPGHEEEIGADGFAADAMETVKLVEKLMK